LNGAGIAAKAIEVGTLMAAKPYVWNGKTTDGFDCSGFVTHVFKALLPSQATSFELDVAGFKTSALFEDVAAGSQAAGDLVIFPGGAGAVNHIGIVLDATYWIGSQSSTGVAKVKFSNTYWGQRTKVFRRVKALSVAAMGAGRDVRLRLA
jgi:cell wall-associated NlpC family hydrolase